MTWHCSPRRLHLYLQLPPFPCTKSKPKLFSPFITYLQGVGAFVPIHVYLYRSDPACFSFSLLRSNRMTLLGAGVAYLYYTPMLRAPLSKLSKIFPSKRTSTCFQAGPVLKKQNYYNTCSLVGVMVGVVVVRVLMVLDGINHSFYKITGVVGF